MFRSLQRRRTAAQYLVFKRHRYKKKWAVHRAKKSPTVHALEYFDNFYKPVFDTAWPSMRAALLSQQKYCALINNFSLDEDEITMDLMQKGSRNMISMAAETEPSEWTEDEEHRRTQERDATINNATSIAVNTESATGPTPKQDMYDFMPVTRVMSRKEKQIEEEIKMGFYEPRDMKVEIVPDGPLCLPQKLQAYVFEKGDVRLFPPPKKSSINKLGYYPMDAASILPVIALDLKPDCSVLDLCAAPGGKSLAILQTALPGSLLCVDKSWTRCQRIKEILHWYVPKSYMDDGIVKILHEDGIHYCRNTDTDLLFDRVLVDVPCNTDRHVLQEDENNIFRPIRTSERLQLTDLQKHLLCGGIQRCKPGGTIVYSTCTLSPPQNDGVIQAALEHVWHKTRIDVVVQDTRMIADQFREVFHFYNKTRFGQLVVPNLTANFGPMYFCKLQRIR